MGLIGLGLRARLLEGCLALVWGLASVGFVLACLRVGLGLDFFGVCLGLASGFTPLGVVLALFMARLLKAGSFGLGFGLDFLTLGFV